MPRLRFLFVVVAFLIGGSAFAALSPKYTDWPNGPEQWLMTRAEHRAWKDVKTDEDAQAFIDLFWARRDPSPGTPENEFRAEFDARVAYADAHLQVAQKRGSLTDPGRVLILLGPSQGDMSSAELSGSMLAGAQREGLASDLGNHPDSATGRSARPSRLEWVYPNAHAIGLTGNVVFYSSVTTHEYSYDPRQGNIVGALSQAVDRAIANPNLTAVPDWAKGDKR